MFDRQKILLVDPSAIFRRTLKEVIETRETSVEVGEAEDGLKAIRQIRKVKPELVLLDLSIPKMGGI